MTSSLIISTNDYSVFSLKDAKECFKNLMSDERLMSYLKNVPGSFSGMSRVIWSNHTTPIDKLDEVLLAMHRTMKLFTYSIFYRLAVSCFLSNVHESLTRRIKNTSSFKKYWSNAIYSVSQRDRSKNGRCFNVFQNGIY